jgi:P pilus assembly chaperone PapD
LHLINPILLLLVLMSLVPALARADATLFIYPTFVMFEGNQRSAEVTLTNRGDQTGTFEMSWSDMIMTPEGGLIKNEGPAPWSVQPYVRYSPRRVTLMPSDSQIVKIALRRGKDVPEGEYYSHFRVLTLNSEDPLAGEEVADEPVAPSGVTITARTAIAIPIIWRNSRATSSASIESVRIDQGTNKLTVAVQRHGQLSVRGYLHVFETAPDGAHSSLGEPTPMIIYPSIEVRTMAIALKDGVIAASLPRGTKVYFSPDLEMTDKSIVFASYAVVP